MAAKKSAAEEKEVAVVEETTAIAPNSTEADFLSEEAANEDEADYIPRLRILQKGPDTGKLQSEELALTWDEMTLALIKTSESRVLWPESYSVDNHPLCRSHDGLTPAGDIKEDHSDDNSAYLDPMSTNCADCNYAKWSAGSTPPRCHAIKDLLVLDLESSIPFYFSLSSTALTPYKSSLAKPLQFRKMALTAQRSKQGLSPAHSSMFSFKVATEVREGKKGDSYIPKFSDIAEQDEDMQSFCVQVAIQLRDFSIRNVKESDNGGDNDSASKQDGGF